MESLYQEYRNKAQFFIIYVREAHPADGWQVPQNIKDGWVLLEPVTFEERTKVAKEFLEKTKLTIPTLIDNMDNKADADYKAWPDRVYIIEIDGKVLYKGAEGPWGFKPLEIKPYFDIVSIVKASGKISTTWGALKQ